ncbi:hypothetical protein MASR2M78_22630 [Treponema sp.]
MKLIQTQLYLSLISLSALFALTACPLFIGKPSTGSGPLISRLSSSGTFNYEVDTGSDTRDIDFVFTASADRQTGPNLKIAVLSVDGKRLPLPNKPALRGLYEGQLSKNQRIANSNAEISGYLRTLSVDTPRANSSEYASSELPVPRLSDNPGDPIPNGGMVDPDKPSVPIPATCRYLSPLPITVAADGTARRLSIVVADDQWGVAPGKINVTMVTALADRFLKSGDNNDIYDWLTTILGSEWGTSPYSNLIPHTGDITIFLTDIYDDPISSGTTVGYFWSVNNFKKSYYSVSNERIMFVIDASSYANGEGGPDGATWNPSDYWPDIVFSTLAHEFQHMIHFYQKQIVFRAYGQTDVWIDEMCSQLAEDLLADKMGVLGPRGVPPEDGSAGSTANNQGRIPSYNEFSYLPLEMLYSFDLVDYSTAYAFGAWAARNYGGAEFLRRVVRSPLSTSAAVSSAAAAGGARASDFDSLIARWAVSVLNSDRQDMPAGYQLNSGSWFESKIGGATYRLGSIDFFNYSNGTNAGTGPLLLDGSGSLSGFQASANVYYSAAMALRGKKKFAISLPEGIVMHIVMK